MLERAGAGNGVQLLLLTAKVRMEGIGALEGVRQTSTSIILTKRIDRSQI